MIATATTPSISISRLLEDSTYDLKLELIAGREGLGRKISHSRIQKPGLALTGLTEHLHPERMQVFGNTEISYLRTLTEDEQRAALSTVFDSPDLSCVVVTKGLEVPRPLMEGCERVKLTLMRTTLASSAFISQVQAFLEETLTATGSLHGVLVDVFGVGVLLLGKSGIGKSEIALDLVMRGHRLVADDIVNLVRKGEYVHGFGNDLIQHHMEIRGLGIINIKDLFGVAAVRDRKKIELIIELVEWDPKTEYDRLGLEQEAMTVVGVEVPHAIVPVRPGRNMTTIVEVAARNHLLKLRGHHSALDFAERLNSAISGPRRDVPLDAGESMSGEWPRPSFGGSPRPTPHLHSDEEDVE